MFFIHSDGKVKIFICICIIKISKWEKLQLITINNWQRLKLVTFSLVIIDNTTVNNWTIIDRIGQCSALVRAISNCLELLITVVALEKRSKENEKSIKVPTNDKATSSKKDQEEQTAKNVGSGSLWTCTFGLGYLNSIITFNMLLSFYFLKPN